MLKTPVHGIASALLAAAIVATPTWASRVVQMGFEEAARSAGVIVIGRVTASDDAGTLHTRPGGSTYVVRKHRIRVSEYLKGHGPSEIVVETLGGKFVQEVNGKPTELYSLAGGQPQLPEGQDQLLLFLSPHGGNDTFMISSASHGVVAVQHDSKGCEIVQLVFGNPDVMPPAARQAFDRAESKSADELFPASVELKDLPALVQRAVAPKAKPIQPETSPSP
jgi:hypothetical protein